MPFLPPCQHRGAAIGDDRVECRSNRLLHAERGIAQRATCAWPCPYADHPQIVLVPLRREPPADRPCVHRGAVVRTDVCDLCSLRGQPLTVFACDLHGECSLHKQHSRVRSCAVCPDAACGLAESSLPESH